MRVGWTGELAVPAILGAFIHNMAGGKPIGAGTCPLGGLWYECYTMVPTFQGCCLSNPCQNNGCPLVNLTAAGIPEAGTAATNEPNVKCPSTSLWWTCLDQTPSGSFQGCCKSDPCNPKGCPVGDLEPAQFKITSTSLPTSSAPILIVSTPSVSTSSVPTSSVSIVSTSSVSTSNVPTSSPTATMTSNSNTATVIPISNNVTASLTNNIPIIAGVVVGGVVLIAIIGFLFWYLRSRKRKQHNTNDPSSLAMMRENKVPDNAVNTDNQGYYAAGLGNGIRSDHDSSKDAVYTTNITQSPGPPPYVGGHSSPGHLSPGFSPTAPGFNSTRASAAVSRLSSTDGNVEGFNAHTPTIPQQLDSTEIPARNRNWDFAAELPSSENLSHNYGWRSR